MGLPLWTGDTGRSSCSCHFQLHPCRVHPEDGLERWNERNSRHQAPNTASTILAPDFFLKSGKQKKIRWTPILAGVSNDKKRTPKRFDSSSNLRSSIQSLNHHRTQLTLPIHPFPPLGFPVNPLLPKLHVQSRRTMLWCQNVRLAPLAKCPDRFWSLQAPIRVPIWQSNCDTTRKNRWHKRMDYRIAMINHFQNQNKSAFNLRPQEVVWARL